ncbi:MAG: hypothetical protein GY805_39970, partial [Chloroflexi bacterium]|nr:hypothetical protein [Chloroflexota bacterium]
YGLHDVTYDRLVTAIREATLEIVRREAFEAASASMKMLDRQEPEP